MNKLPNSSSDPPANQLLPVVLTKPNLNHKPINSLFSKPKKQKNHNAKLLYKHSKSATNSQFSRPAPDTPLLHSLNKSLSSLPTNQTDSVFKPSNLVISLSSNSPTDHATASNNNIPSPHISDEIYYESILDRTLRTNPKVSFECNSTKDTANVSFADSASQTSEDFNRSSFLYRVQPSSDYKPNHQQQLEDEINKIQWSNLSKNPMSTSYNFPLASTPVNIRPSINTDEFFKNYKDSHEDSQVILSTSPLSNFSHELTLEPPNNCIKPSPKKSHSSTFQWNFNAVAGQERFNCGSSDGGGSVTSSASSFSTLPSNLSSPGPERIYYNNFDKSQLPWSSVNLNYRG
ncbi:hypothetical protein HK099_000729, partial [Clydaea vesicula]